MCGATVGSCAVKGNLSKVTYDAHTKRSVLLTAVSNTEIEYLINLLVNKIKSQFQFNFEFNFPLSYSEK